MKRFLALSLAMVMVFAMLAGCSKTEGGGDSKVRTDIVICDGFDIVTFDPPEMTDVYSGMSAQLIYDRLVKLDENGQPIPMLAKSWKTPTDTEYIFTLEKGVKFHNGDPMTAKDVVFSLLRAKANPKSFTEFEQVKAIEAVDDSTVKLTTIIPFAPMLLNLATSKAGILSEKHITGLEAKGEKIGDKPIGTGCMSMAEYRPNSYCLMKRFDEYWGGKVKATSIKRMVIPEESSRTIALERGEVDYIDTLPSVDVARVKANEDLVAIEMPSSSVAYIGLNTEKKPFNDKRVRQALQYAINKKNIVEVQFEGFGVESTSVFPNIMPSFDEKLNMYPMDAEKAKALMVEAGYADGFDMEIIVSSELRSRIAQLIQQDYRAINVNLDISIVEFGTVLEITSGKDFDAFLLGWSNATNPDSTVMTNFHSSKIGAAGNRVRLNNPDVDRLIDAARTELDWKKREPMYKEIQNILMDESAWIPLLQQTYVAGMLKGVEGVELYKTGARYFRNMVVNQ